MNKTQKKKIENFEETIEYLKNHIRYLKKEHKELLKSDPNVVEKRHIIIYSKLISYSVILHNLTKNIKNV